LWGNALTVVVKVRHPVDVTQFLLGVSQSVVPVTRISHHNNSLFVVVVQERAGHNT